MLHKVERPSPSSSAVLLVEGCTAGGGSAFRPHPDAPLDAARRLLSSSRLTPDADGKHEKRLLPRAW
eukprot:6170248-Pyramimonas_sp.AAC.1